MKRLSVPSIYLPPFRQPPYNFDGTDGKLWLPRQYSGASGGPR